MKPSLGSFNRNASKKTSPDINRCIFLKTKAGMVMEFSWPFDQINIIEFHKL